MRKSGTSLMALVFLGAVVGLLAACADGNADETAFDGQALLEERCTECHALIRVTGASKSESGWAQTVDRMIAYGAELDTAERDALAAYLVQEYGE